MNFPSSILQIAQKLAEVLLLTLQFMDPGRHDQTTSSTSGPTYGSHNCRRMALKASFGLTYIALYLQGCNLLNWIFEFRYQVESYRYA